MIPIENHATFDGLGIAPKLIEILDRLKFKHPTPIQHKAIPAALEGKDIIGIAQTGTGKTLAFGIPIVQRLSIKKGKALILVPTRELAVQVNDTFQKLIPSYGMKAAVLIGGAPMHSQIHVLRKNPSIIVATPGRLLDHLEQRTVMLGDVNVLVLDEADRMLDMGFEPQVRRILRSIPKERQTFFFSATMPQPILAMASQHMKLPVCVEIARSGTTPERVTQELFIVSRERKEELLKKILHQYHGSVLLFTRTRVGAKRISGALRNMGQVAAQIHADRTLAQRREALEGFKTGKYRILVATDIAARGIDVTGIEVVINYDLPEDAENYIHRIGRTARAGHEGRAISFATPDQAEEVKKIERLLRKPLPLVKHPEVPGENFSEPVRTQGGFRRGRRSFGSLHGRRRR
ncbi:MAG: DEAD/DEAH box helicase [Candidatus Omnitrophica bacterium]|nr:DEAD/DEAH box helicase [Candidatus Omnitrophota bacterium]